MRLFLGKSELALLVVATASITAVTAVVINQALKIREIRQTAGMEETAFQNTERLLMLLLDAETAQRGYLLTGDTRYLQPYENALPQIPGAIRDFESAASALGTNSGEIPAIASIALQKKQELQATIAAARESPSRSLQIVKSGYGNALMDRARARGSRLMEAYFASVLRESRAIESRNTQSILILIFGASGIIFTLIAAAARLNRTFGQREILIAQLSERQLQYEQLVRRIQTVREEERAHLAREIHDELGHKLTDLKFDLAALARHLRHGAAQEATERAQRASETADESLRQMRAVAANLRPAVLDQLGFTAALQAHAAEFQKRFGLRIQISAPSEIPDLNEAQRINCFRIAQEALTNIARHANATSVRIEVSLKGRQLHLAVRDDGHGFDPEQKTKSLGLLGMRERARMIGGELTLETAPGHGTVVRLILPLDCSGRENSYETHFAGR